MGVVAETLSACRPGEFDEVYGGNSKPLDGLGERGQALVAEVPGSTHLWMSNPKARRKLTLSRGVRKKITLVIANRRRLLSDS
ncbi:MAG: hypothetical protein KatS3mg110_1769 [Pirellulaceae bacterium]|nr:MAG: hypothetical protein KatS3mg110_1769 [Pirellulaceae bacterium]